MAEGKLAMADEASGREEVDGDHSYTGKVRCLFRATPLQISLLKIGK